MTSNGMIKNEGVLILSSDDWSSGLKTSKYHIARTLARHNRVLFVNSIGLRSPAASGSDVKRMMQKLQAFVRGPRKVPEGLYVYSPLVFPFMRAASAVKSFNRGALLSALQYAQFSLSLKNPIILVFAPVWNEAIRGLGGKCVCYYCIDDLAAYSGVDERSFYREETRLVSLSDCVVCSSRQLQASFGRNGVEANYVPHGVDWRLFRTAVDSSLTVPEDLATIPRPRLGFYGFLSDEWVDYDLLHEIASRKPNWHVVLIGKPKAGMSMDRMLSRPNLHYLGLKPFEELPAYTQHFDVGLIPFVRNELTASSNPLKLLEYLSGGLPVVTTDIPEVDKYRGLVHVAGSAEEFVKKCQTAIDTDSPADRHRRSDSVRSHSWDERVKQLSQVLSTADPK